MDEFVPSWAVVPLTILLWLFVTWLALVCTVYIGGVILILFTWLKGDL